MGVQLARVKSKFRCPESRSARGQAEFGVFFPLNPRDALYGGHTCAASILFPALAELVSALEWWVEALDFCSLYPWVMKYCDYPFRHRVVPKRGVAGTARIRETIDVSRAPGL